MKTKIFGLMTAIALSMIAVGGLWAQAALPNNPGTINTRPDPVTGDPVPLYTASPIFASPQSDASQGRMRSNADDFIRPDAYTNLKFEKWFGMTSYASTGKATAGIAKNFGSLYLGAFYNGNFWAGKPANNYTEQTLLGFRGFPVATYDVYTDRTYYDNRPDVFGRPSVDVSTGPVNNAALLIGVANMGFRFTYRTNYQSFKKSDFVIATVATVAGQDPGDPDEENTTYTFVRSAQAEQGYIAPQVAWSMAKDLTSFGIRPYVTFDLDFHRDSRRYETEGYVNGVPVGLGEQIDNSRNYAEPKVAAGLGGVAFVNKDGFKGVVDIDYELIWRTFNNEYSYQTAGLWQTAEIKGLNYNGRLTTNSYSRNVITPSVAGAWTSGNVGLRFKLNLPMTITGEEVANIGYRRIGTIDIPSALVKQGASTETSTFAFQPDLRLALSWRVVPKLALYLGGRLQTTAISLSTIEGRTYAQDVEAPFSLTTRKNNNFGGTFTHNLRLGTTLNISDNVWLEAQTGLWNSEGRASVFGTGTGSNGLFEFSSILVGLKF